MSHPLYKTPSQIKWEKRFTFAKAFARFLVRSLLLLGAAGFALGLLLGPPGAILGLLVGASTAFYLAVQYGRVRAANVVPEPNLRIGRPEL